MTVTNNSKNSHRNGAGFRATMYTEATKLENIKSTLSPVQAPLRLEKEVKGCSVSLIFAESSVPNVRSDIAKMLLDTATKRRNLQ